MHAPPFRFRPGDTVIIRADRWRVSRQVAYGAVSVLEVCGCSRANAGTRASFILPFEHLEGIEATRAPRLVRPSRWRRHARDVLAHATPDARALRAAAAADFAVMPFQLEPALALTHGAGCRLLLADAVGLGKTIQAGLVLAEIHHRTQDAHVLVVVPAGLRDQWQHELHRRFGLHGVILDAAALTRLAGSAAAGLNPWAAHPVVIVSIDYVKRPEVIRALESIVWDAVVFDEAHALSSQSDRSTAASLLAARARTVVLMTATPHDGSDEAFARLCGIGALDPAFPLLLFRRTRDEVGLPIGRRTVWLRIRLTAAERTLHEALAVYARRLWSDTRGDPGTRLAIAVLMRRGSSSAASLTRSLQRRLASLDDVPGSFAGQVPLPFVHLDTDEEPMAVLLAPGLRDAAEERRHLRHLIAMATEAATAESKTRALLRLLRRTPEHAIVFTEYRDTLAHLAPQLCGMDAVQLHGGMTRAERHTALAQFAAGRGRLLLATDAASEGLNLHHHCRLVIHLELPWTPLRLEQRVGRVERIGQTRRVHAVHLIAEGTSEETVATYLDRRRRRMHQALDRLRTQELDASVILGAASDDHPSTTTTGDDRGLPTGILVPNLRTLAELEAERLHVARQLRGHDPARRRDGKPRDAGPVSWNTRPMITSLGRSCTGNADCLWVFLHDITDPDGRPLWQQLIALTAIADHTGCDAAHVRRLLDPGRRELVHVATHASAEGRTAAAAALAGWIALHIRREHAVHAAITARHARLSAALLQRGLFDRRTEVQAASQAAVRDEALARSAARLAQLEQARTMVSTSCVPAFAAMVLR